MSKSKKTSQSVEPQIADRINSWLRKYGLDYKLEQESLNNEIDTALEEYYSKTGGYGGNRPDAKLLLQDKNLQYYPILIEYKGYKDKLVKLDADGNVENKNKKNEPYLKNIKSYAVNGAVHYANAILQYTSYTEIISIGVTGYNNEYGELVHEIGVYYVSKSNLGLGQKVDDYTDLSFLKKENFDNFIEKVKVLKLTQEEIDTLTEKREKEIEKSLKKLNKEIFINENGISEKDRVYLVAASIIVTLGVPGKVKPLEKSDLKSSNEKGNQDGDIILRKIDAFLGEKNLPKEKKDLIVRTLQNTLTSDNINKVVNGESQLKRVFTKIIDTLGIYYKIGLTSDFTGKLFNEMYSWLGFSDDKLNDVVLTPPYVSKLLVKLAHVNKNSYVWDFATGSAGLLVAAMNEMIFDARNTIKSPDELNEKIASIKMNQLLGIEILPEIYMLAVLNMILMGDGSSNILNKDSIVDYDGNYGFIDQKTPFPANAFVLNPPYSKEGKGMVFVEKALAMMERGYGAIIIQSSAGSGQAKEFNKRILTHSKLLASIKMPIDLFRGKSSVQTYIYVFRVGEAHKNDDIVKFIDFSNDGYSRNGRKKTSTNLKDTDHAKERYQEIVDLVEFGKKKLNYFTENEYYEGTIDVNNGADWNQSTPIDIKPKINDLKNTISNYLIFKVSTILKEYDNNLENLISLEEQFIKDGGSFKNYILSDIFDVLSSKKILHANKLNIYDYNVSLSYPYVTRTEKNNGIKGYIIEDDSFLNPQNTLSLAQDTFFAYYQEKPFYTGNNVKILVPKIRFNKQIAMYIVSSLNKAISEFSWGKNSDFEFIKNLTINLPIKNDEIDFEFMEKYITAIEKISINNIILWKDEITAKTKEVVKNDI